MRRFLPIFLAGLLMLAWPCMAWAYDDTGDLSAAEMAAVDKLSSLGIMEGYPDGTFRPQEPVSRAELAKIVCVNAGLSELTEGNSSFSDVSVAAWYYGWVSRAAEQGWVKGYPDGGYLPQASVTQQEAVAVLLRAADIDTALFDWPADYIQTAQELGMLKGFSFSGSLKASRLHICLMIYNLLEVTPAIAGGLTDGMHVGVVKAAEEREFALWNVNKLLPLTSGVRRLPKENTLIYYTVGGGAVENWTLLLDAANGSIAPTTALKRRVVNNGPYTWVATRTGNKTETPVDLNAAKPLVRFISYRNIAVGPNSLDNRNYWLGDECQIYEAAEGKLSPGSRESIEVGQAVTLLVNDEDEALFLICW